MPAAVIFALALVAGLAACTPAPEDPYAACTRLEPMAEEDALRACRASINKARALDQIREDRIRELRRNNHFLLQPRFNDPL